MSDRIDEQPYRDAIVEAVEEWLDLLKSDKGNGITGGMQLVLQRGRELRAARLANRLEQEPKVEVKHG